MIPKDAFSKLKAELYFYNINEVADAAGVSDSTIRNWLSADRSPTFPVISNFVKVANVIGLKLIITVE